MNDQRVLDGRYEVGELIGRGGMADVYLGRDIRLGRRVAIKLLRADLARDPLFQSRFRREAQAVAALNHPSIVSIFDTGDDPVEGDSGNLKVPFIVMEYVDGHTLRELIQAKDVTIEQAISYALGVLSALEYSHRAGIVHRDIKPANVIVTGDGGVKVMDFGIARAIADSAATMTQTQAVVGTAQYLSPEQARGETVDARSDLYSAACLLYEMAAGRPPFVGDSPVSVAYQHVREIPEPPSRYNPEISGALDSVLLRALRKDREHRFPDAAAFREALLQARDGGGDAVTQAVPLPAAPSRAPGAAAGVAAGLAGAALGRSVEAGTEALPAQAGTEALPASPIGPATAPTAAFGAGDPAATQAFAAAQSYPPAAARPAEPMHPAEQASQEFSPVDPDHHHDGEPDHHEPTPTALAIGSTGERPPEQRARRRAWTTFLAIALLLVLGAGAYLVYSLTRPPATVAVPDVSGRSQADAMNMITAANLRPFIEQVHHDNIESGDAIGTDPAAGSQVELDSQVTLRISTGPSAVVLPADLAGKTEAQVRDILRSLNLVGNETTTANSATVPRDMLISTSPALGSTIPVGSTVDLVISTGQVTMPNLVELSRSEAEAALQDPAVALPYRFQEIENSVVPAGTVTNQSVPAGSNVDQGTAIVITVAKAPPPPPSPSPSPSPAGTTPPASENNGEGTGNGEGNGDGEGNGNGEGNAEGNGNGNGNGNANAERGNQDD